MTPDTSAEAVERRIRELQEAGFDNAAATLRALLAERDAAAADALVAGDAVRHYQEAHAQAAREVERLRAALECCVAAMDAMAADAQGDMTDADNARLWNAALDAAEAALRGGADND